MDNEDYYEDLFDEEVGNGAYRIRGLAWKAAEKGDFEVAEKLANCIDVAEVEEAKMEALGYIACRIAKTGDLAKAESIVKNMICHVCSIANYDKVTVFFAISSELLKVNNFVKIKELMVYAEEAAQSIDYNCWQKAECLCRIGGFLAKTGERENAIRLYEQAEQVVEAAHTENDWDCEGVLSEIRSHFEKEGEMEQVERITNSLQQKRPDKAESLNNPIQENLYCFFSLQRTLKNKIYINSLDAIS